MTREEILKIAKPILFNTEMVRAVKDNRKTVTRRAVKLQGWNITGLPKWETGKGPNVWFNVCSSGKESSHRTATAIATRSPYLPGDILYVPEAWRCTERCTSDFYKIEFRDGEKIKVEFADEVRRQKWLKYIDKPRDHWQSPYFMPKEAARLCLRVTDVRVERLQDITEGDVCKEGAEPLISCQNEHGTIEPDGTLGDMCWNTDCCGNCMYIEKTYGELFGEIVWNTTIKPADVALYGWDANPWVWVIKFEKMEAEK